jgi:toxin ParE1/3/4
MSQYRLEPSARIDLTSIADYIAQDNLPAAERLLDRFHETFRFLAMNPLSGERRPDLGPELRQFTMGNYVILFTAHSSGVAITNVIHGARDLKALFTRDQPRGPS